MVFRDKYEFLSNFYTSPIVIDGVMYNTVENAYQSFKTNDFKLKTEISKLTPGQAKKAGKKIESSKSFNYKKWESIRVRLMTSLVTEKFHQNPLLAVKLKQIKGPIEEDNTWGDTFWGICDGFGDNNLGKILEKIRNNLLRLNSEKITNG
jgi:ribA/ribD-fused uncharacterized protein